MNNNLILLIILFSYLFVPAVDATNDDKPLVTTLEVTRDGKKYWTHFIYNSSDNLTLKTEYLVENDVKIRLNQTEWIFTDNRCVEQRMKTWKEDIWNINYLINNKYSDDNLVERIEKRVENGINKNYLKSTLKYNNKNIESKIEYKWVDNTWQKQSETQNRFNSHNLVDTTYLITVKNDTKDSLQIVYNYSVDNKLIQVVTQNRLDNSWNSSQKLDIYYDKNSGLKSSEIYKKWNERYKFWESYQNIEYKYSEKKQLIEEDYQYWSGLFWMKDIKYRYVYNSDNQLINKQTYVPMYGDYRLVATTTNSDFLYQKPSLIESKFEFWGGVENQAKKTFLEINFNNEKIVEIGSSAKIGYTPVDNTGVSTNSSSTLNNREINVYPNPSAGVFYLRNNDMHIEEWSVVDLNGKVILQSKYKTDNVVDLGNVKSGVYLLKVKTTEGDKFQKLMKN